MLRAIPLSVVLVLSSVTSLHAGEGVLEINQTCAVSTGCFAGDAAGFPVTIQNAGSYQLTGNLSPSNTFTNVIEISAPAVSVDLNGFAIQGITNCSGVPPTCLDTGSGIGVTDIGANLHSRVSNGSVRGMGSFCVQLGSQSTVEDLSVASCGVVGIVLGDFSAVRNSRVRLVGGAAIQAGSQSLVENNVAVQAGGIGVQVGGGSVVSGNAIGRNQGAGLDCIADGNQCSYAQNSFTANVGGSVSGSELRATGGNTCQDGLCASRRKYYLSRTSRDGANALSGCAAGYHMASLFEIHHPPELDYDSVLGHVTSDSGRGPPAKSRTSQPGDGFEPALTATLARILETGTASHGPTQSETAP